MTTRITNETIKILKEFSKLTDKNVKFEYHNIHFHADGYAYFPIFPAIIRFKYDSNGLDFSERDSITINCKEFLAAFEKNCMVFDVEQDASTNIAWINYKGNKRAITPQEKFIKNINKLFSKKEEFKQYEGKSKNALIINKTIPQILSLWTLERMSQNNITDFWYNADYDKDIVFCEFSGGYECLFAPVIIRF